MSLGLDALTRRPPAYTPEFTYVRGRYMIGAESLSYFAVGISVREAVNALTLPRDVVLDPLAPIRMEELFQRELDEERAVEAIGAYIKRPKQPKFFNSLTVVVLPVDPENGRLLAHEYPDLPDRPQAPDDPALNVVDVGPVRIRELATNTDLGTVSWDTGLAKAIIVDGQHRFFAVKHLMGDETFPHRTDLAETTLPVLLLVLDKRAGFESDAADKQSVLATCRALFIDLNKHALPVSAARQHLLNDRDLAAVAMRRLMSDMVGGETRTVAQRVATDGQLPLALLDWSSEEARFDASAYLSTTLTLYDIVQMAISFTPPKATDHSAQRDYVAGLIARLELDAIESFSETELRREIDRAEERGLPFELSNDAIRAAADGFRASLGSYIVHALAGLLPYAELIRRYEEDGLLSGAHEQWLGLDPAGRVAYVEEVGFDPGELASSIHRDVKEVYRLAYQVVFQKAFIQALLDMDRYRTVLGELWRDEPDIGRDDFIAAWIDRFNLVVPGQLASNDAWGGAGINAAGTIVWTQASQRAIASFMTYALTAPMSEWAGLEDDERSTAIHEWLAEAWRYLGAGRPAASIEGLYKLGAPWKRSVVTYVKAQFKARDEEAEPTETDYLDHAATQLARFAASLRE